jgi:hypothetical protein
MDRIVAQQVRAKSRRKAAKVTLTGANYSTYQQMGSQTRVRRNNFPHYEKASRNSKILLRGPRGHH